MFTNYLQYTLSGSPQEAVGLTPVSWPPHFFYPLPSPTENFLLFAILRPGPILVFQRQPFAQVVDRLHLTIVEPDLHHQPVGERPRGQDDQIPLWLFLVGADVGDEDAVGVVLFLRPEGDGRCNRLCNCVVHGDNYSRLWDMAYRGVRSFIGGLYVRLLCFVQE